MMMINRVAYSAVSRLATNSQSLNSPRTRFRIFNTSILPPKTRMTNKKNDLHVGTSLTQQLRSKRDSNIIIGRSS
jgi:hypothetical protein